MWLGMIKEPGNIFFMIVLLKALPVEGVFATIVKHWIPGKNLSLQEML